MAHQCSLWISYQVFIGHYSPTGNHFFANPIKDTVIDWLDPKLINYPKQDDRWITFEGYLQK